MILRLRLQNIDRMNVWGAVGCVVPDCLVPALALQCCAVLNDAGEATYYNVNVITSNSKKHQVPQLVVKITTGAVHDLYCSRHLVRLGQ